MSKSTYILRKGVATLADLKDGLMASGFAGNVIVLDNSTDSVVDVDALTLSQAVSMASAGDVIAITPGYTETLAAVVTMSTAGVSVIGLGVGDQKPAFTVSAVIDGISLEADDILIENIRFVTPSAAATSNINIAASDCVVRNVTMAAGANFDYGITVTAAGEKPVIENCDCTVTADGPIAFVDFEGVIDRPIVRYNNIIGSDGTNQFDNSCLDFSAQAITNPVVMYNVFNGQDDASPLTAIGDVGSVVGDCFTQNYYPGSTTNADSVAVLTAIGLAADSIGDAELAADTILGDNNNNNAFDSSTVVANRDGSIVERLEAIYAAQIDDGATNILGVNDADNVFDSSAVVGNADGSIVERQEYTQAELAKVPKSDSNVTWNATALASLQAEANDALIANNLDHFQLTATADTSDPVDISAEVADNTVLAHVLTDDGDSSDYDRRYMSLEALSKLLQVQFGYQMKSVAGSAMPIAIWYLDANIAASGDGKTPATAFKTLAEAISACSNSVDDWILVYDYSGGDAATVTINKSFVHIIGNAPKGMPYPRIMPASADDGLTITDAADRVEIANLVIGAGDQTKAAIAFSGAAGSYGCYIHDCVIGRDATAPALLGISVPAGVDAPYLVIENNRFMGQAGAGIAAAGSAIKIAGNMTYGQILNNRVEDVGRTATPAIWLSGTVVGPVITGNQIKTDTDTGTGSAITLSANVSEGWVALNYASDGKDAPAQNPFVDAGSTNGWSQNYSGIVAVLPA